MGFLTMVLAAILGIAGSVFVGLLKDEAAAWLPTLNHRILSVALRRVPSAHRDRYAEEWAAHILEYPGKLSQLVQTIRFLGAGMAMEEFGQSFVHRKRIAIAISLFAVNMAQIGSDFFVGTGYNFWVEHLFGFAHFVASIWFGWAVWWLIRLKPYIVGEREPRGP